MEELQKEYDDLKKEFDIVFSKLYLATEENKSLKRENKRLEKKINLLLGRIVDLSHELGIKPSILGGDFYE